MNSEMPDHHSHHHNGGHTDYHPPHQQAQRLSRNAGKYTCPMHPEIVSDFPGDCPKCGMALEPIATSTPSTGTIYTCPMHPQVQQDYPGDCPICGMPLEPKTISAEDEDAGEIRSLSFEQEILDRLSSDNSGFKAGYGKVLSVRRSKRLDST